MQMSSQVTHNFPDSSLRKALSTTKAFNTLNLGGKHFDKTNSWSSVEITPFDRQNATLPSLSLV